MKLLTDEENTTLILSLLASRGDDGATEEEVQAVLDWAREARLSGMLVDMALAGEVSIDWKNGEPIFGAKSVS